MNGCKTININFDESGYLYRDCTRLVNSNGVVATSDYYTNLNYFIYNGSYGSELRVCKYDKDLNPVGGVDYIPHTSSDYRYDLDPNYYYKFSISRNRSGVAYNCNETLNVMSQELITGSSSFLDTSSSIFPFIILVIGLVLAFYFLKKLVYRSNNFKSL